MVPVDWYGCPPFAFGISTINTEHLGGRKLSEVSSETAITLTSYRDENVAYVEVVCWPNGSLGFKIVGADVEATLHIPPGAANALFHFMQLHTVAARLSQELVLDAEAPNDFYANGPRVNIKTGEEVFNRYDIDHTAEWVGMCQHCNAPITVDDEVCRACGRLTT